jgi:dihydroxy-acid dehydratase
MTSNPETRPLRSRQWFDPLTTWGVLHRAWPQAQGIPPEALAESRPVVGIANSWSELNNCNANLRTVAESVKRGVLAAGGLPLEFPVMSLGEILMKPTTMLYRNLMAMEVEENIRAHPLDAVVLLSGCDKTTPAMLMGALSADVPALLVTSGPMLRSRHRGRDLGSGHNITDYLNEYRAGQLSRADLCAMESCISRSAGHCMVMGTASTMAALAEGLGMTLPDTASIPGPDSRRLHLAERAGARAVQMATQGPVPSEVITQHSLENAVRLLHALGGSSNAVLHLMALARRAGWSLGLAEIERLGREVPLLADIQPSGRFVMEDFHEAGGVQSLLKVLAPKLHLGVTTVTGETLGSWVERAEPPFLPEVIRPLERPVHPGPALRVLRGSLCPAGAVIKASAASPHLLRHRGPAWVWEDYERMQEEIADPTLPVTKDHILVLKGGGPKGAPGMPEWGVWGVPQKLFRQGVHDIIRISDARASGTSHGTIIVHVAPEAADGGPIGLVETGDLIELDVPAGRLELLVPEEELERRRRARPPLGMPARGYRKLYLEHVTQADAGCDFDFMHHPELKEWPHDHE